MVDTETKADRKARRFPGRIVWVVRDRSGNDHCLLYCSIKGRIRMAKSLDEDTHKVVTARNRNGRWRMDDERQN